jgi:hypothetical protein
LLSYLSQSKQAEEIRAMTQATTPLRPLLRTYADLVDANLISHKWFAEDSWTIKCKRNDTALDRSAIASFNKLFRDSRPKVASEIHRLMSHGAALNSSDAIRAARILVATNAITAVSEAIAPEAQAQKAIALKLRRRFDEHLRTYMTSERFADKWSLANNATSNSYSGYLADVLKDIAHNRSVVPIFASSEIATFVSDFSSSIKANPVPPVTDSERNKIIAHEMGIQAIGKLVPVGFQGVDEVVKLKSLLAGEITNYNQRMHDLAEHITATPGTSDASREIRDRIDSDLVPALSELEDAIKKSVPSISKWLIGGAAATTGGFAVGSIVGLPFEQLLALAIPAIGHWCSVAQSVGSASTHRQEIVTNHRYFGLTLISTLREGKWR